ncbi:MAG: glycosyltransferase family 4 protein [Acidobacteria bacterium]|nr:glycosyltransferase family 4 protein [Acidobacteriota bacterium]
MILEFANAMVRRGHTVRIFHHQISHPVGQYTYPTRIEDISWFDFDPRIEQIFSADDLDLSALPSADIFLGYSPSIEDNPRLGLPIVWVQGYKMLGFEAEQAVFEAPCPKVCVARWLVDVGTDLGVSPDQLVHIPIAIHHDRFEMTESIEDRPERVGFLYHPHPQKGASAMIDALSRVRVTHPGIDVVAYGASEPAERLPSWVEFIRHPTQQVLVDEIYSSCRIFVCASRVEGFGLANIEAMACGAALVTTDNGGSRDYAFDHETARVAQVGDIEELVTCIRELLDDEQERVRIARAGQVLAATFTWDESARHLENYLDSYRSDPGRFRGQPKLK